MCLTAYAQRCLTVAAHLAVCLQELLPDFAGMWFSHTATTSSPKGNLKFLRQIINYAVPAQGPAGSDEEEDLPARNSSMSLMSCSNPKRGSRQGAEQVSTSSKKQCKQVPSSNQASSKAAVAVTASKQECQEGQEEPVEE